MEDCSSAARALGIVGYPPSLGQRMRASHPCYFVSRKSQHPNKWAKIGYLNYIWYIYIYRSISCNSPNQYLPVICLISGYIRLYQATSGYIRLYQAIGSTSKTADSVLSGESHDRRGRPEAERASEDVQAHLFGEGDGASFGQSMGDFLVVSWLDMILSHRGCYISMLVYWRACHICH